jgi:hypothetical protein
MGAFLITLALVALLITGGVVGSVCLYLRGEVGAGRFRRVQRVHTITSTPDGTVVRETVEEIVGEKIPVSEEVSHV